MVLRRGCKRLILHNHFRLQEVISPEKTVFPYVFSIKSMKFPHHGVSVTRQGLKYASCVEFLQTLAAPPAEAHITVVSRIKRNIGRIIAFFAMLKSKSSQLHFLRTQRLSF